MRRNRIGSDQRRIGLLVARAHCIGSGNLYIGMA